MLILVVVAATLGGCGTSKVVVPEEPAALTPFTPAHSELTSLPSPKGKIPVSVYNFRDQTGQYKFQPNVSSFSTAVTQGATSMLIKALNDSGWFLPLEREGLQDLLTERKIIRAAQQNGNGGRNLPPLMFANLLIEGGIIGFESNVKTGGAGARYFGIGASTEYRVDQVTVYLRAVDITTGRILDNVSTTKTIYSREVRAGVFRFVSFKKLLEVEAGYTTNEPTQLCVLEAVEKAVAALVIEGIVKNHWQLANPDDIDAAVITEYLDEKNHQILDLKELET